MSLCLPQLLLPSVVRYSTLALVGAYGVVREPQQLVLNWLLAHLIELAVLVPELEKL